MVKVLDQVNRPDLMDQGEVVSRVRPREINMPSRWERVADDLRHRIRTGVYPVGTYLPSYRLLAEEYTVSVGTIRTAFLLLRAEGWVEGEPGIGVRVRADHPA